LPLTALGLFFRVFHDTTRSLPMRRSIYLKSLLLWFHRLYIPGLDSRSQIINLRFHISSTGIVAVLSFLLLMCFLSSLWVRLGARPLAPRRIVEFWCSRRPFSHTNNSVISWLILLWSRLETCLIGIILFCPL
jgi:hypothetical protein